MTGTCPNCKKTQELAGTGNYLCGHCRKPFDLWVAAPRVRTPAAEFSLAGIGGAETAAARCALHENNAATGTCERCGDFMCGLCATAIEGRTYCPRCFDLLHERGSLRLTQERFTQPQTALNLGIASIVCIFAWYIAPVLGIAAIALGVSSLRQIAKRPDLPGRGLAIAGIVLGSSSLLLVLVFGAYLVLNGGSLP